MVANVPLVAGAMKMYPLIPNAELVGLTGQALATKSAFVQDGSFWHFLAYCAAGVAAMGMEKIPFFWYLKRISWLALIGYLAGAGVYIAIHI